MNDYALTDFNRKIRLVQEQKSEETIHALAEAEKNIKNAVEVNKEMNV